jgi:perosamine synthetase
MTSTATQYKAMPHPSEIISAIEQVVGNASRPVALHEPLFPGHEGKYVQSCIDDGWVSSVGAFVDRFEHDLASYCEVPYAVVMVNGTCALHAALVVMGVETGDEVLVPSLTFVATANAVMHAGAVPHFVEVEEQSLGMDPRALDQYLSRIASVIEGRTVNTLTGRTIRAVMPVHVFGHPCQLDALQQVADKWHIGLLEDATEALGSRIGNAPVGKSRAAAFSFNGNKIITTGGGGAVVTQDESFYRRLKHLTTTAKQPHAWAISHDEVGWNYRMPNLNAALGCAQLEQMPRFLEAKRALAQRYMDAFSAVEGVRIMAEPQGTRSNYWLVTLIANEPGQLWVEETLQALHNAKLLCRPVWTPLHLLPMYRDCPRGDLALTEQLAKRIISLPSSVKLGLVHV